MQSSMVQHALSMSTSDQEPFTVIPNGDDGRALFVLSRNRQQLEIHDCRVDGTDCSVHQPSILAANDETVGIVRCNSRDLSTCTAFDTRDTLYTRPEILVSTPKALLITNRRLYIAIEASKFDTNNQQYFYVDLWSCDPNTGPTSTGCINVPLPSFTPPNTNMVALAADSGAVYVNLPWTGGGNRPVVVRCGFGAQACSIVELRTELEDNAPFPYSPATAASYAGRALFLMHYTDGSDPLTWSEGVRGASPAAPHLHRRPDLDPGRPAPPDRVQARQTIHTKLVWTGELRQMGLVPDVYNGDRSKYFDRDYFIGNSAVYTSRGHSLLVAPFTLYSVPNASTGKAYAINIGLPCKAAPNGCVAGGCAALGYECGTGVDACGRAIDCGGCAQSAQTCGGGGVPNRCG
eukprot:jgi/Chlat1/3325/Chrsp22S03477